MNKETKIYRKIRRLRIQLTITCGLLFLGLILPMLSITKFLVISNEFSVISGVIRLWQDNQYFLFFIVGSFSVLIPIAKIIVLYKLLHIDKKPHPAKVKLLQLMHDYGRWAMLDVMVVAVLIVTVKLGALASIKIHPGLYFFAAAVFLIMFITQATVRLLEQQESITADTSSPT